jgi:KipI family sensor histidine kinase inhibitor
VAEVIPVADDRVAVAVADTAEGQLLARRLRQLPGCIEAVGGIAVVECQFDLARTSVARFTASVAAECALAVSDEAEPGSVHDVPVAYGGADGPDLETVCKTLGLDTEEFIRRHTAGTYRVAMLGFTPGFAYLDGMDATLAVPRRELPRQFVPAGSVGIAGGRSGLYALDGPGGWQIVGRTPATLFNADADDPFRLAAGDRVRFVEADE